MKHAEVGLEAGITFDIPDSVISEMRSALPFEFTGAQKRVITEILRDMKRPHPMNRLLQGDVGSGKTAVAATAILAAVRCGYQAALMAPTEILAEQHAANLGALFQPLGLDVELLVGKQTPTQKKKSAAKTASGEAHLAIGTHALIQEGVEFAKLGLVIVDEQHRFGVLQRGALRMKGYGNPDVLVMTATPIPRTLTLTLYGDLDLSVIDEMPPSRKPIKTHWKTPSDREDVYRTVRRLIETDAAQAYIVCPLVSESEKMLAQAADELHKQLSEGAFRGLRVGVLHGQMKSKDKVAAMDAFRRHELDALVSTTVIEVGVDVPNANIMVIEDANRFGLAQLHQLRGRVGRGDRQSFCLLIGSATTQDAETRLRVMVETTDGFRIAEEDLRIRGPGELYGTKQSGDLGLKIADLLRDGQVLEEARQAALAIVEGDPKLSNPEHRLLKQSIMVRNTELVRTDVS
jgi:ATP-dependent DNA helicase RecG